MFRNWLRPRPRRVPRCAHTSTPRFRPGLEALEDRSVPTTFNVTTTLDMVDPADGKRSLREAVTQANRHSGADVIVLPVGVFKIGRAGADENGNATGDFDITGTVTIQGAGAGRTVIDGHQLDRVFDMLGTDIGSSRALFQGMTISNGDAVNFFGGGVQVVHANLVVRDCAVTGNQAASGGGISATGSEGLGNVTLIRTTVAHNAAVAVGPGAGAGGGVVVFVAGATGGGSLTLRDSAVRRNNALTVGGGIYASTATLTNSTVSGNTAYAGGGIYAGSATLTNSTVRGNSSISHGGGIYARGVTVTKSTISGNSTTDGLGGGIVALNTGTLTNSTVSGNSAGSSGGGIYAFFNATLLNCTVVENRAVAGGGVFHDEDGTFNIRNTIIALNGASGGSGPDVFGTFASGGHNLIGMVDGSSGWPFVIFGGVVSFTIDLVGTGTNPIDPKLGPLADNGGPTQTHKLLAGSPAIDRGDNTGAPPTDQRGVVRKKDGNGDGIATVDIGAFER